MPEANSGVGIETAASAAQTNPGSRCRGLSGDTAGNERAKPHSLHHLDGSYSVRMSFSKLDLQV
jgi:hypothetical protein